MTFMYEWFDSLVKESTDIFRGFSLDWDFQFNDPASEGEIEEYELKTGIKLPLSYKLFLLRHNGAHLFCSEAANAIFSGSSSTWASSGVLIFSLSSTIEYRNEIHGIYETPEDALPLPIAYLGRMGTGDFCSLGVKEINGLEKPVLDCDHDYSPKEWSNSVISASFEEWIKKMFDQIIKYRNVPEYWYSDTLEKDSLALEQIGKMNA